MEVTPRQCGDKRPHDKHIWSPEGPGTVYSCVGDRNRSEQRKARLLAEERGIKYTEALRQIREAAE